MKFMVIVKATKTSEAGAMPSEQLLREMTAFNEQLVNAGVMLAGEGLHPSSRGARVRFSKGGTTVIEGPFPETNQLVAGFWLWNVKSKEEAITWARKIPNPMPDDDGAEVEIRQVADAEDFAASDPSGEVRAKEEELRKRSAANATAGA